jgi:iron complex outermembrane receptor protein
VDLPEAARVAPSQTPLAARSAQSVISSEFIRNYTSPVADFSQVVQMSPGAFNYSPNGPGLGDTKTFFRGFKDGQYTMTFDGIPFNDTNDPTHHSWAFFPSQFTGGAVFDRSPGSAATIGPANFGGSINLLSRTLANQQGINGTLSYGSFNTRLLDAGYDSGRFGAGGKSRLLVDVHQMQSDGYQTFNSQKRDAFSAKYQFAASEKTSLTVFSSVIDFHSQTPNQKGATRAQIAQFGDNFLMSGDPAQATYYGYNFYHIPTDFDYVGVKTDLGHGWSIDDKVYTYRYYNKQNFNSTTAISTTSATDKLNSYRRFGNLLPITQVSQAGILRTGLWSELAWTDRFQAPSDPRTWVDAALPNFHEKFTTTTLQPYAEYEIKATNALRITPGIKLAYYKQDFTQFADNGKTVGSLNGAPSIEHAAA